MSGLHAAQPRAPQTTFPGEPRPQVFATQRPTGRLISLQAKCLGSGTVSTFYPAIHSQMHTH